MGMTTRPSGRIRVRAAALFSALVAAGLFVAVPVAPAHAAAELVLTKDATDAVLVGDTASVTLTAANPGTDPVYNLSFRDALPLGVTYVEGSTRPTALGEPQVFTAGSGAQTLVWSNVSDLPVGAEQALTFGVSPDVEDVPVGSTFDNVGQAYANADPRTLPRFTSTGAYSSGASVQAGSGVATTSVTAIKVEKFEPSPEHELIRGVHDHTTTYTLEVTNNDHNPSNGAVLVDHLPAQLEFLGCGTSDHTPAGAVEYPGAPRLDVSTPDVTPCVVPTSVDTVTDPAGLPAGVYTRVQWDLGGLAPGAVVEVEYAAGIPQRSNTDTFPDGRPSAASLEQGANLANNTGPSTRETGGEQTLTNRASVTAEYDGPVAPGADTTVGDRTELDVSSEDLAVQKSASTDTFTQGGVATYELRLETGEYADTTGIVLTDVIPNGLCPLGGAGTNYAASSPTECEGSAGSAPSSPYDSVTENSDGTFTVVFAPIDLAAGSTTTVTYQARMLATYRGGTSDPTVVGDGYVNRVSLTATSSVVGSVDAPESGDVTILDVSSARMDSESVQLDKRIQPNSPAVHSCSDTASDYRDSADLTAAQTTFTEGSRVCFLLEVRFPGANETKNAVLTDFLPDYLEYEAGSAQPLAGHDVATSFEEADLTFTLGDPSGTNRFVPRGQTFRYRLSGRVTRSSSVATPDVTGNLAKLRWTNTDGEVGFLRDSEDFSVPAPPPATVVKTADRVFAVAPGTTGDLPDAGTAASARVRAGDVVEFTVAVGNGGTAADRNDVPVVGPDVWDRLPAGIACADVSLISDGGACTDPGAAGHPSFTDNADRSAIRWDRPDTVTIAPAGTLGLTYRVTYPATVATGTTYVNDVDVASYATESNVGTLQQHFPADNVDTTVPAAEIDVPRAHDDHTLRTPVGAVTKTNETELADGAQGVDPDGLNYAAVGETVTYTVTATLPAHTTVYSGRLADAPPAGVRPDSVVYEYRSGPADPWGPLPVGFTGVTPVGTATPPRIDMPAALDTEGEADELRMVITATVVEPPTATHNGTRTNTASLTLTDEGGGAATGGQATSSVTTVVPSPAPTKAVDDDEPVAGQVLTFTVTARNLNTGTPGQHRPPLYDAVVLDCVPGAFEVVGTPAASTGTVVVGTPGDPACAATDTPVRWTVGDLAWRSPADAGGVNPWPTLTYQAETSPAAAGGVTYTNIARLTGTSMPGAEGDEATYTGQDSQGVTVPGSELAKSVTPSTVTIGDEATYTVQVTLPADVNFYDATLVDTLPAGIAPDTVELTGAVCEYADDPGGSCSPVVADADALAATSTRHGWFLGDVLADTRGRTLTVTYTAVVGDVAANVAGKTLPNTAVLSWNQSDELADGVVPAPGDSFDASTLPGQATVTVVEPDLSVTKAVSVTDPVPGETFAYTVRVTNATGSDVSAAHDVDVRDVVPAGVLVDAGTISGGGVLTGGTSGGGTIDWSDLGPLAPGAFVELTYEARLVSPAPSTAQTNVVGITAYTSLDDAGRTYAGPSDQATVSPGLPELDVVKDLLDPAPAYLGESTDWRIRVTNTGPATAHDVDVSDVLPEGWSYDAASAQVSVAGAAATQVDPQVTGTTTESLAWEDLGDLATGEVITIDLSATPGSSLAPSRVGATIAHVNVARATAQDLGGTDGSVVTTDEDDARTQIDSADLRLTKTTATAPVAGAEAVWTLTVTNGGADTARGPFIVTDTLPVGVTGATATGPGWSCSTTPPADEADPATLSCQRTAATDTLASGASLADITVRATVPADATSGTELTNAADVEGRTHDPDPSDNSDEVTDEVTVEADLGVAKSLTGTLVPGTAATYGIAVTNTGPSVARGPIVVADTLPAGLAFKSATAPGWDLVRNGQQLTFTWTGATPVPVGALSAISVTVDVASSVTGAVTNTATVSEPTDPTSGPEAPDTDSVTSTPVPSADLSIEKTSVSAIEAGAEGTYEMVVNNLGPSDAAGPVTVTDTLPAMLSYESVASDDPWTCAAVAQDVTCELAGGLSAGSETTFRMTVAVDADLTTDVSNTATVDSPTADPNPGNDSDDDDSGIDVKSDLRIDKTLETATVVAGEDVTYRLQVRNDGPATSPGTITVTDALPAGIGLVSAAGTGWSCAQADGEVTCDRSGSLAPETDAPPIMLVGHVASGVGAGTLVNHASVDGPAADPTPANNADTVDTPVTVDTEVSVVKTTTGADPVRAGATTTFEILVSNTGSSDARGVTVTDVLPAGMTLVTAEGTGWTCEDEVCTRDRVVAGQSAPTLTVVARVASATADGTQLTNRALVSTSTAGDTPAGNEDDAVVDVVAVADLALAKSHATGSAVAGEPTSFSLQASNAGLSDSVGPTTVTDELPDGLSYLSASAPWTCVVDPSDAQQLGCTIPSGIAAGTDAPALTLQVMVAADADAGTVTNAATVSSPTDDDVPANDSDTADVDVQQQADVSVVKSHAGPVRVGKTLGFTLVVANDGPSAARDVVVTDTLPAGLDLVSADGAGWTCSSVAVTVTCELSGRLAPGATADPITVLTGVTPAAYPAVRNLATVETSVHDADPDNNTSTDEVPVPALVDLAVAKEHVGALVVGEQGRYRITVTNHGPTPAPGPITVTDALPAALGHVSAAGAGWTCGETRGVVTCRRTAPLGVDESAVVDLVVDVLPAAYPTVQNSALVTSASEETDDGNGRVTDDGTVRPTVRLALDKEAVSVTATQVVYELTVTNHGPSDTVEPIRVVDPMPRGLHLVSAEARRWSCTTDAGRADCTYAGSLAAGDSRSFRLVTRIDAAPGTEVVNVARVLGGGGSQDGQGVKGEVAVRVPDDQDPQGQDGGVGGLPDTGGPSWLLLLLGGTLVAGGGFLLRKRRQV